MTRANLWFLQRDSYEYMPVTPADSGNGGEYAVTAKGEVRDLRDPDRVYELCQWTFPPAEQHEIVFRKHKWEGGRVLLDEQSDDRWSFTIRKRDILSDAQLRAALKNPPQEK